MAERARALDEDRIIRDYFAPLARGAPGAFGLRDDAALIAAAAGTALVVTMDTIIAGIHVLEDTPPGDLAWKALAVNLSDLAAKAAEPAFYLMSLALPRAPEPDWLAAFADGLAACQERHGLKLLGGDTVRTTGPFAITITALGRVREGAMVPRGGGRPGDLLYVSGTIGDAALGLGLARSDARAGGNARARGWGLGRAEEEHLLARYRRPAPRTCLVPALRDHARAALDISDGLVRDLGRLANTSGCGALVEAMRVPLSGAARMALDREPGLLADLLTGGDDYEILAAIAKERASAFETAAASCGISVTRIGRLTEPSAGIVVLDEAGAAMHVVRPGYTHF